VLAKFDATQGSPGPVTSTPGVSKMVLAPAAALDPSTSIDTMSTLRSTLPIAVSLL
jgi:hypothetical protein